MEAILLEVKAQYRDRVDVRIFYMETDAHLFRNFRVTIVPSQVFLDASGQEVFRNEGVFPKEELVKKLRELRFIQE
jgi:thioredoxin 1